MLLTGRHVRLEPLSLAHLEGLLRAASGARESYALTTVPADEAGMRSYLESALADQAAGRAVPFATVDLRGPRARVVGSTRFGNLEHWAWPAENPSSRPPEIPDAAEIGWTWLTPEVQRTAINTEAKLLMLSHAFEGWQVHRVTLKTDARNQRSRRAIERLGARLDGLLRAHLPAADPPEADTAPRLRDSAVYSILAAEWPQVKARLQRALAATVTTTAGEAP